MLGRDYPRIYEGWMALKMKALNWFKASGREGGASPPKRICISTLTTVDLAELGRPSPEKVFVD